MKLCNYVNSVFLTPKKYKNLDYQLSHFSLQFDTSKGIESKKGIFGSDFFLPKKTLTITLKVKIVELKFDKQKEMNSK